MSTSDTSAEPLRRPTPSRVAPERRATGMFRRPDDGAAGAPSAAASSPPGGGDPASATPPDGSAARRAVDAAYRICEDYLARGRDAARGASTELPRMDPVNARPDEMLSHALRLWQDTARMWAGYMTPFLPGNPSPASWFGGDGSWDSGGPDPGASPAADATGASGAGGSATARPAAPVSGRAPGSFVAEVEAAGPARLEVELFRALEAGATVPALWPAEGDVAPVRGVAVRWEGTTPVFAVSVPAGSPAGRYEGPVRDAAGRTVGLVVLSLRGAGGP